MPDPFEALRLPLSPVDPDPRFAARLRARLARVLDLPKGVIVSTTTLDPVQTAPPVGAAIPYLAVRDGRRALDWYVDVLGARRRGEPIMMPDGRVGHAELDIGGGVLYLAEEFPEIGHVAPTPGAASVSLVLTVADVDATAAAAVAAGAELTREIYESHGSRNATIVDPFGHRWMLQTSLGLAAPSGSGAFVRVAYVSLWVPDADRASAFFSSVLGWAIADSPAGYARQVEGATPNHGVHGGHGHSTLFLCHAVDDVRAAAARVRAAGGQAGEPTEEPFGLVVDCVDDQGVEFALYEDPSGGGDLAEPPRNGVRQGDVAYITLEVTSTARARAFYGAVLGWQFSPGRVDDGWQVDNVTPMVGMHGGHELVTAVPMYRVDDIDAAVARVRSAGGTATAPQRQPYAITSDCVDDQGTRFYLGQL